MNSSRFRISISSPPDRELLVAEVFFDDVQWAELNQESGALKLELYPRPDSQPWVFDLEEALQTLQAARIKLVGA